MKNTIGLVTIGLGLLLAFSALNSAKHAKNLPYLMGTYLPGIILVAVGAALRQDRNLQTGVAAQSSPAASYQRRQSHAEMGVIGGVLLMLLGSGVSQQGRDLFLLGLTVSVGGWLLMILGAANYAMWKGYSAWFGLFGLLLVPGLIVLACLPKKATWRDPIFGVDQSGENPFQQTTPRSASVVGVLLLSGFLISGVFLTIFIVGSLRKSCFWRSQESRTWSTLMINSPRIAITMPDKRTTQDLSQETPQGQLTGEMYQASDGLVTYTVVVIRAPGELASLQNSSHVEKVLDGTLDDWAGALNGSILYRKTIGLGETECRELAMEFTFGAVDPAGASIPGRGVGRTYFIRGFLLSLNVVCNKSDYDKDASVLESRIARFFDSLKVE